MKTLELLRYSRRMVKGRRRELLLICSPPIFVDIFFRVAEAAVYSVLLYLGAFTPLGLFTGESVEQVIVAAVFTLARWIITAPLYCAAAVRLVGFAKESERTSFMDMLLNWRFIFRSLHSFFLRKLICVAMLVPAIISGAYGISLISSGADDGELFIASNLFAACVFFFSLWLSAVMNMAAVPFILAEFPDKSVWRTIFYAVRFMRGRRRVFIGVAAVYLPLLPLFLPDFISACIFGITIFFKEDEYTNERAEIHCRNGETAYPSGVSA